MATWQEEPWTSPNAWRIRLLQLTYRYRVVLWAIWWWVSLIVVGTATGFAYSEGVVLTGPPVRVRALLGELWFWPLLVILLLNSLLLVSFFGWFGVRFRYLAWGAALLAGTVVRFLRARWRGLMLLPASLLLAWIGYRIARAAAFTGAAGKGSEGLWRAGTGLVALALFAFAVLLWGSYRARRRIVVQAFRDLTGLPGLESCTKGLSERLCGELSGIAQLYRLIDEIPGQERKGVYGPAVEVLDAGDILQGAVSADTSIDLKFLKIPVEALLKLGRRLVHERWLSGSLHHQDGSLLLLASMTGGGVSRSWKVEHVDLDDGDRAKPIPVLVDRMIQQLAYRIATDLVSTGSPKWRAVRSFTKGLRAVREAQRSELEKHARLQQAERAFLRALSEDASFAKCHYNLGIVYGELGEGEAAEAAFRRALQYDPQPSAACYALAERYYASGRFADAIWFAKNAIRIRPDDARAWHLRSVALYKLHDDQMPETRPWIEILETEEVAVALAWRDLCRWLAREPERASASDPFDYRREMTTLFTMNLAVGAALRGIELSGRLTKWRKPRWLRRGTRVSRQAAQLTPRDASAQLLWVWALLQHQDLPAAAHVLERIFAGGLVLEERVDFWSYVLASRSALATGEKAADHAVIANEAYGYLLDTIGIAGRGSCKEIVALAEKARQVLDQARSGAGKKLKRPLDQLSTKLTAALEQLPRPMTEDAAWPLDIRGTSGFYAWRLEGIVHLLERVAGEAPEPAAELETKQDRYVQARRETLDWLHRTFGQQEDDEPQEDDVAEYFAKLEDKLEEMILAARDDWQWAGAHAELGRGTSEQEGRPAERERYEAAVRRLEAVSRHSLEIVEQGLYAKLARSFLVEAEAARRAGNLDLWLSLLRDGLAKAEKAAELRPDGADEHRILGRFYFALEDYRSAEREWDTSFLLKPDPEVLNWAAEARWRRGLELADADERRAALRYAVQLFNRALELCENNPALLTARGLAHFWLGVFHRELLQLDEAIFHHKVACAMGARPLEARASLGWAYLEAGLHAEAERTFEEVQRQVAPDEPAAATVAIVATDAGAGEEMPTAEVRVRTNLGLALLYAEKGLRLRKAEKLIRQALPSVRGVRAYKQRELAARCYECLARIDLRRYELEGGTEDNLEAAFKHVATAIERHARADGYWILAGLHLSRAEAWPTIREKELRRAREACERARRADLRGRRVRDLEALERRIEEVS